MHIESSCSGSRAEVRLHGRLDGATAEDAEQYCLALIAEGVTAMDFRLDNLDYLSSAGVALFIHLAKKLGSAGISLAAAKPAVERVLELSGLRLVLERREAQTQAENGAPIQALAPESLILPAQSDALSQFQEFAGAYALRAGFPEAMRMTLDLIIEEVVLNIVQHGYGDVGGAIELKCAVQGDLLLLEFIDAAAEFDPLRRKDPDIECPLEERQVGGLGIYLVKQLAASVEYERRDDRNVLKVALSREKGGE